VLWWNAQHFLWHKLAINESLHGSTILAHADLDGNVNPLTRHGPPALCRRIQRNVELRSRAIVVIEVDTD
jgi:hypothetical protein